MPVPLRIALRRHAPKSLFEVRRRPREAGILVGFVVAWSDRIMLFHTLEPDTFRLNGYSAIQAKNPSAYRVFSSADCWQCRALQRQKIKPTALRDLCVNRWRDLLVYVAGRFPLIVVHTERQDPEVCHVGEVKEVTDDELAVHDLDSDCEWQGVRRFRLRDITRLDFGDGYSVALASVMKKRNSKQSKA